MIADTSEPVEITVPKESGSELLAKILRQRRIEWNGRGKYKEPVAPRLTNLPVLPKSWVWASLDQLLLNITDGDHQPPPQTVHGVPFLVIGNVRSGKIEFADSRFVSREYADAVDPFRKPTKGDILYSLVGSYGMAIKVVGDEEFCIQRHLAVLRPHSLSPVSFLALILNSLGVFQQATSVATGTAQKTVPLAGLRQFAVPLPPLDEQRRIVAEIEKQFTRLEAGVTALRQVKAKLKCYRAAVLKAACEGRLVPIEAELAHQEGRDFQSAKNLLSFILADRLAQWAGRGNLEHLFQFDAPAHALPEGWTWAKVDQLASPEPNSITDGPFGSNLKTEHYTSSGPRVVRLQNIGEGTYIDEDAHISEGHFEQLKKHRVVEGDIVIAAFGANPPRSCIIPERLGPAIVKADCIRLNPHRLLLGDYINYALNSEPGW